MKRGQYFHEIYWIDARGVRWHIWKWWQPTMMNNSATSRSAAGAINSPPHFCHTWWCPAAANFHNTLSIFICEKCFTAYIDEDCNLSHHVAPLQCSTRETGQQDIIHSIGNFPSGWYLLYFSKKSFCLRELKKFIPWLMSSEACVILFAVLKGGLLIARGLFAAGGQETRVACHSGAKSVSDGVALGAGQNFLIDTRAHQNSGPVIGQTGCQSKCTPRLALQGVIFRPGSSPIHAKLPPSTLSCRRRSPFLAWMRSWSARCLPPRIIMSSGPLAKPWWRLFAISQLRSHKLINYAKVGGKCWWELKLINDCNQISFIWCHFGPKDIIYTFKTCIMLHQKNCWYDRMQKKYTTLKGEKYQRIVLIYFMYYLFQQKRDVCAHQKKLCMNVIFLLLLCDGKRARQVLYISIVQSGQEKNEKERAFCVRAARCLLCVAAPSIKRKREEGKFWLSLLLVCIIIYHAQVMWVCVYLWFIFYSAAAVELPKYKTAQWIYKKEAERKLWMRAAPQHTEGKIYILYTRCCSQIATCQAQIRPKWIFSCYPQQAPRSRNRKSLTWKLSKKCWKLLFMAKEVLRKLEKKSYCNTFVPCHQ